MEDKILVEKGELGCITAEARAIFEALELYLACDNVTRDDDRLENAKSRAGFIVDSIEKLLK